MLRRSWPKRAPSSATGRVYVSFDVDGVDPGFAPGTGTPEVGGLTPREVLGILRGLAGIDIVGGDVVEVAPQYDATTNTAQIGAQVLFELLCLVAIRRAAASTVTGLIGTLRPGVSHQRERNHDRS